MARFVCALVAVVIVSTQSFALDAIAQSGLEAKPVANTRSSLLLRQPTEEFHFRIEIEGIDAGYFKSVDGLQAEIEVIEY